MLAHPRILVALAACLIASGHLTGCRGCGSESERAETTTPHTSSPQDTATAPRPDTGDDDLASTTDAPTAGELCYLLHHYGPLSVAMDTLAGGLDCTALTDDPSPCEALCATSRSLGPATTLPRSLSWRLPEPSPQLTLTAGATGSTVRLVGPAQDTAVGTVGDDGRVILSERAALEAALDPGQPLALALAPQVALRDVLDAVPLDPAGTPRLLEILVGPAPELARSGQPITAAELARSGSLGLELRSDTPGHDDLLLVLDHDGLQLTGPGGQVRFARADCSSPLHLCLAPTPEHGPPAPLVARLDLLRLDQALAALVPAEEPSRAQLWLSVGADVPLDAVVRTLDLVLHRWPEAAAEPAGALPPGLAPVREHGTSGAPLERFADAVVRIARPQATPQPTPEPRRAQPTSDVPVAAFDASPGLDKALIQAAVGPQVPRIDQCLAEHAAAGQVDVIIMTFSIDASGQVASARVEPPTGVPAFEACVLDLLDRMTFAAPEPGTAPVEVRYPLAFGAHE